jgi:FHA domain-containing protein
MANARFRAINTELSGREYALPDYPAVVGRSSSCDICVRDQSISRQHVRAQMNDGRCVLTDLGSHNGILVDGQELREVTLESGERFELGDVAFEFVCDPVDTTVVEPAPQPPAVAADQAYAMQQAGAALPADRPVYVDDIFGAGAEPDAGPGQEEEAAVAGARGALKYTALILLMLAAGALMWNLAGGEARDANLKPVLLRVNEVKVIDLGAHARQDGRRMVAYIDHGEQYLQADVEDEDIVTFELDDKVGFMATLKGLDTGTTDVKLTGPSGRRATVRVLVRGMLDRPYNNPRLTPAERLAQARLLYQSGKTALNNKKWYLAVTRAEDAYEYARPVRTAAGLKLQENADRLRREAKTVLDEQFELIKLDARAYYRDKDRRGAARAWERLRQLVPDPDSEMHQKLTIMFNRTIDKMRRGY